jgi:outer membrane protein assembly factor BamB
MDKNVTDDDLEQQLLGRYWDDLVDGKMASPPGELDARLAETVRWLHAGIEQADLESTFDDQLRRHLMTSTGVSAMEVNGIATYAPATTWVLDEIRPRRSRKRTGTWALTQLATAALLVLTLGSMFIAFGGHQLPTLVGPSDDAGEVLMHRGNAARTGVQPGPGPKGKPMVRWQLKTDWTVTSGQVVADGYIYVPTSRGAFYALDVATGQERWRFDAGTGGGSSRVAWQAPAVADGIVYVGSNDHHIYAFDGKTGEVRWRTSTGTTGNLETSTPAIVDGVVFIGIAQQGLGGAILALDAIDGHELWRFEADGPVNSSPAVVDGVVYVGSGGFAGPGETLFALDAGSGEVRWQFDAGSRIPYAPAVADGVVYANSTEALFAIDAATGTERWHAENEIGGVAEVAVANGLVYVATFGRVSALDASTGAERWQVEAWMSVDPMGPVLADGVLYAAGVGGDVLLALDPVTGEERWHIELDFPGGITGASPTVVDGVIYIAGGAFLGSSGTFAVLADPVKFVWQTEGGPETPLTGSWVALAIGPAGNLWVPDGRNDRFQIFASDGTFIEAWGTPGSAEGQLDFAAVNLLGAAAFDPSGNLFVADSGNHRIQKFDPNRRFLTAWGSQGLGDGQFSSLTDIAVDGQGRVYATDYDRNDIQVFDGAGHFLASWSNQGEATEFNPNGITVAPDGNVWVAEYAMHRIQQFSPDGTVLAAWGEYGVGDGQLFNPVDLAVDGLGRVYVVDYSNSRIQVFSSDGQFLAVWGGFGNDAGEFASPNGIVLDGMGNAYVVEDGGRVQKFRLLPPLSSATAAT